MNRFSASAILVLCNAVAVAEPLPTPPDSAGRTPIENVQVQPPAEGVHVQPRGSGFDANSEQERELQTHITIFNQSQDKQDMQQDKDLRICRGC